MNSRDMINELIRNKKSSQIGLYDSPWTETLVSWTKEGYPTNAAEKPVSPVEYFQFDMESVGGWFNWEPRMNEAEVIEETDEWILK